MGFGKWLLGGVCAVGAVVAAPVMLPAAGIALVGGGAMAATGSAIGVAATAGAVGVAAEAVKKKIQEDAYDRGKNDGYVDASEEYKNKGQRMTKEFSEQKQKLEKEIKELTKLIAEYRKKEELTQEEMRERDQLIDELLECISQYEEGTGDEEGDVSEYIEDARTMIAAFR